MLKIGLTGGIGSGKSTVARLFAELNIPIIDADEISNLLVAKGQPALDQIVQEFGPSTLNSDGFLDRKHLKNVIFSDSRQKLKLEAILHPLIYKSIKTTIEQLDSPYCIACIPLLIETGMTGIVDRILVVDCPVKTQVERVQARDHLTVEKIQAILDNQVSRSVRIGYADDIIDNSETNSRLAEQVKTLHNLYLSLACQD